MRTRAVSVSLVVLTAALFGPLSRSADTDALIPPENDRWIQVQTAHFTLYSDASERRTLDLGKRLERFRAALSRFNKKFKIDPPVATFIYVFKDDAAMSPYKKRFNGRVVELSGLFAGRPDGYYIVLNGARQDDPLEVIYHEYTHHFLENNLHRVPAWFNEGLAECCSTFKADDKTASIGLTKNEHVLLFREHDLMPLHDLFAITYTSPDYNEGERRGPFYAESWVLMHYLMWDKPERSPQFLAFLDRLSRGEEPDTAFPASFGISYQALENELRVYVRQARFAYTAFKIADLGIDETIKVAPMKREEALNRLGDLLIHLDENRAADAESLFREAQRLAPDSPTAFAGLAYLAQIAGRFDEAVASYDKAIKAGPADPVIYFHLGQCLARRAPASSSSIGSGGVSPDLVRAEDMFGQSIRMRPGFGEAFVEYARIVGERVGDNKAALPLLEAARSLLPSRVDVLENLAVLYARTGNGGRARDLVENVLARMNDPAALESARNRVRLETGRFAARQSASTQPPAAARHAASGFQAGASGGEQTEGSTETQDAGVAAYNRAVSLANQGDYKGAIATLKRLLIQVKNDEDFRSQVAAFLDRLQKDAARLHKPTE